MNGYKIIDQSTTSLNITLYRNVAKLTLVIDNSNSGSGVTIKTVQVKDISTKLDYFYQYIKDKKSDVIAVPYPSHHLFTTFDYPTEQLEFVRYRFYLGENMMNDYNIRPNYHYEMYLTFNGFGDPSTDARVTHMDAVVTESEANCYMLHPYRKDIATNANPSTREYSWSWHLWITDYNSEECRNQNWDNRYIDVVQKGEVHHYVGELWDADDAKYHNKWIMDRNLGSLHSDGHAASMGLFYQFGRKDPLPYKGNVYTFNSNYEISSQTISPVFVPYSNTNTLDYIVKHPQFYYQSPSGDGNYSDGQEYIASNPYSSSLWNDPNWNKREGRTEKSFFDPCPPEWRIPEYNIWSGLKSYEGSYEGFILYCDNIQNSDNTCRYYAYGSMGNSLNYFYKTTSASYFSSTPVENSEGGAYGIRNHVDGEFQTGYLGAYTGRQRGNQIRPIQE